MITVIKKRRKEKEGKKMQDWQDSNQGPLIKLHGFTTRQRRPSRRGLKKAKYVQKKTEGKVSDSLDYHN